MAFKKPQTPRTLEFTSLIDIVFILLIFFLVSFAFSVTGDVSESSVYSEIELPRTEADLTILKEDRLENLLIQIVPDTTDTRYLRRAYVLWPSFQDTLKLSRSRAFSIALRDSTFAGFERDFLILDADGFFSQPASVLISNSIEKYVEKSRYSRKGHPVVEVRAEKNTEFKILNFIMTECSKHKEVVPQIVIRTAP